MDTKNRLSAWTLILHWLITIAVLGMLFLGYYMVNLPNEPATFKLIQLHKSIGITVLVLSLLRLGWRWKNGWLEPFNPQPRWQQYAKKTVQSLLMVITILMPISGIIMSYANGHTLYFFGYSILSGASVKMNAVSHIAWNCHVIMAVILIGLITVHLLASVVHTFLDKDLIMQRMLGKQIKSSKNQH